MIEKLSQNLFNFDRTKSEGELLFFKLFELYILSTVVLVSWQWALAMPEGPDIIFPSGIGRWIDISFMLSSSWAVSNAAAITLLSAAAFFRIQVRWIFFLILLLLHLQYVARFSLGKLPHSVNFLGISLLGFALGFSSFSHQKHRLRFVLGFILFFLGLAYISSALSKLGGTGINWSDGYHLWLWIAEKQVDQFSTTRINTPHMIEQYVQTNYWIATLFLLAGLLTEALGFLLWWRKSRPFIAICLLGLHVGIGLTMDIYFVEMALLVLLIGFPWSDLLDRLLQEKARPRVYSQIRRLA
ncbi:MAG: hypothetical protein U5K69_25155 [Balneolaceae bacterium]|nr:hypothetical protein [Balneolaceae bacterium]